MRRAALVFAGGAAAWIAVTLGRRYRRFAVSGRSMEPCYRDGDFVVADMRAYGSRAPAHGDVVVALDPRDVTRTLVKRVERHDPTEGSWLLGDNPAESTDSRTFGWVPDRLVMGRIRFRYWPWVRQE